MKKFTKSLITITAIALMSTSTTTIADTLIGAEFEVNYWAQSSTASSMGNIVSLSDTENYALEATFEHPIPLLPNLKTAYSVVDNNLFSYNKTDITFFYEIFDNDLVSVDLGAGASVFSNSSIVGVEFSGVLPYIYVMAELGIPATPLFLYTKANILSIGSNTFMDYQAGLKYEIGLYALDFEVQAGYRQQDLNFKDFGDLAMEADMKTDGFFAGITLDF